MGPLLNDAQQRVIDEAAAAWEVRKLDPMMQRWLDITEPKQAAIMASLWREAYVAGAIFAIGEIQQR